MAACEYIRDLKNVTPFAITDVTFSRTVLNCIPNKNMRISLSDDLIYFPNIFTVRFQEISSSSLVVGAIRNMTLSHTMWLTIKAPSGTPIAYSPPQ